MILIASIVISTCAISSDQLIIDLGESQNGLLCLITEQEFSFDHLLITSQISFFEFLFLLFLRRLLLGGLRFYIDPSLSLLIILFRLGCG